MSIPSTIQTSVAQAAITKVTRLFNGSIKDVLTELLQNARRAGASQVEIEVVEESGCATLIVRDDGYGINDPQIVVTLGQSAWEDEDLARRETPAGMGIFSMAGHRVEIRSRPKLEATGWRIVIEAHEWEASTPIAVDTFEISHGTEIRVKLSPSWIAALAPAVADASRYYPVPVTFQGEPQGQENWLDHALSVNEAGGIRIGVYQDNCATKTRSDVNFHGVGAPGELPSVRESTTGRSWTARVDIVDAPDLQLVLPARKELVQNTALDTLRVACKIAIYRHIASQPSHRLSFEDWTEAADLGVPMAEADPHLLTWIPPTNDSGYSGRLGEVARDTPMMIMPSLDADVANSAARALDDGKPLEVQLVEEVSSFKGYSWYDAIPQITDIQFVVVTNERTYKLFTESLTIAEDVKTGRVDAIYLSLEFTGTSRPTTFIPTDVVVVNTDSYGDLDDAIILLTHDATIGVTRLTNLLERAFFSDSDDSDADSYETQEEAFGREAKQLAMTLLLGEEKAILTRIEDLLRNEALFLRKGQRDRTVAITLTGGKATARYVDPVPADAT